MIVTKMGLDGHNRGAYVIAHGLRDAGMEVIYTGIRQTAGGVAQIAVQEGADVIGVSSMVGAHLTIARRLRDELDALGAANIQVLMGGIIPEEDFPALRELGVYRIYGPGSRIEGIVRDINLLMEERHVAS